MLVVFIMVLVICRTGAAWNTNHQHNRAGENRAGENRAGDFSLPVYNAVHGSRD